MKKRGHFETNWRWAVDGDLKDIGRRRSKPKAEEEFVVGEEAARPELIVTHSLEQRGVTADAVPGLMEHAWKHTDVEDREVSVSLYELCQVFSFFFFFLLFFS
jgi:hypothetical protein